MASEVLPQESIDKIYSEYPEELAEIYVEFLGVLTKADMDLPKISDHSILDKVLEHLKNYRDEIIEDIDEAEEGSDEQKEQLKSRFEDLYNYTVNKINNVKAGVSNNVAEQEGGKRRKHRANKKIKKTRKVKKSKKARKSRKARKTRRHH